MSARFGLLGKALIQGGRLFKTGRLNIQLHILSKFIFHKQNKEERTMLQPFFPFLRGRGLIIRGWGGY